MSEQEMLDYLLSTGLYEITSKKHPYNNLFYEYRIIKTDKTIPIKELVERFIEIDGVMTRVGDTTRNAYMNTTKERNLKIIKYYIME